MTRRTRTLLTRAARIEPLERRVLLSLSPAGGEFPVNTFTSNAQTIPAVAADADGDFVVAWQSEGQDGSGPGIYAQRFDAAGTPRGPEFLVNDTTFAGSQFRPAVAMDADGDFVIAWDGGGGLPGADSPGVFARRYDAAGVPQGTEFQVNTFTAGPQNSAAVAMDAAGNFVVAWQSRDQEAANDFGIYAQRYDAAGVARGPEIHVNTVTGGAQTAATLAMDASGDFVIAWVGADASFSGVRAQRFNAAGAPQGTEFPVNTTTASDQNFPAATMDASGDFVIAWNSAGQDGSGNGVYAQRYNAGGVAQGVEFRANTFTTGDQENASAAMGADGDFLITWRSLGQDGGSFGVYGQAYDAAGVARGGEFLVNTTTFGSQSTPAAAVDADGNAAVAWQSNSGGAGGEDVVARRYDESDPDAAAPVIGGVFVNGARVAAPYSTVHGPLSQLVVSFSENVSDAGGASGPNSVTNPANWLLTRDGVAQAPSITYGFNPAANRFEAVLALASPVASGNFFLKARDTLRDIAGNRLDGDFDGAAGGTLSLPFSVSQPGPRGGEFQANTFSNGTQRQQDVATDAEGNFVVAWVGSGQGGLVNDVYAQRFSEAGVALGPEFRVNTFTTNSQLRPAVAMDADGDFVVVWDSYEQDGSGSGIYAQRYDAGGVPQGGEFRANTTTNNRQNQCEVAMSAGGAFVIAWASNQDPGGSADLYGIYAQRYNSAGVPQGGEFRANSFTPNAQRGVKAAMDADGDFVIAWSSRDQDFSAYGFYAQRYNAAGVAQGGEFRVNTFTTGNQFCEGIAMDADGDFVAVWSGSGSTDIYGTYAKRFNAAGAAQAPEFRVNTFTTGFQLNAAVAMDPLGNVLVAWTSEGQDGSELGVYAQRYHTAGVAQGGELRVNTFVTGGQFSPEVAVAADGDSVVAWSGEGLNGYGVYAQRYRLRALPTVATLTDTPDPVTAGNSVTFSASGVASPDGAISSVSFYRESNGEPGLQVGAEGDTLVGTSTAPVGGFFSASASTAGLPAGTYTYWAQARDELGLTGPPTSTTNTVLGGGAPAVTASQFRFETAPNRLQFTFNQDVSASLGTGDVVLQNLTASTTIPSSDLSLSYDTSTNVATFTYTGNASGIAAVLPDGNYRATLDAAGITNGQGTPLPTNHVFTFFFLMGDANRDARVNLADFNILAANFGQSPRTFSQGDFNYDTVVTLQDFNRLAARFGQAVGAGVSNTRGMELLPDRLDLELTELD